VPIVGNLHLVRVAKTIHFGHSALAGKSTDLAQLSQLPARGLHKQFARWAEQYGPIFSLMLGTKLMVVLSSPEAVKEILDRQSAVTSARQDLYIAQELASGGQRMLLMVSSDRSLKSLCRLC
jgi:cytochrome P450